MKTLRKTSMALLLLTTFAIVGSYRTLSAQCVENPTRETAVGLQNASSYFATFYIDRVNKGGVPSGDRSVDFIVSPGDHTLRAEAVIGGESVSATRVVTIPAGYVCTWTITDPTKTGRRVAGANLDYLKREALWAVIPLVVPNW